MINNWSKFNEFNSEESNSQVIQSIRNSLLKTLKDKIEDIRDIFVEFGDSNIIERYSCEASQTYISCTNNDFDRFISNIAYTFKPKDLYSLHSGDSKVTIGVSLYLPGKRKDNGNAILTYESISLLEDIIVAAKRLKSSDFEVELDMNGSHRDYKPIELKISFNI